VPNLLANVPDSITVNFGNNPFTYRMFEIGIFAQDDWRVSSKLVVNMGLRYNYFSNFVAKPTTSAPAGLFNLNGLLDSRFTFGPFRDPSDPFNSDPGINLGPRLGLAYNPDGKSKTVIRAGFGTLFSPLVPMNFTRAVAASKSTPFRSNFSKTEAANYGLIFPVYNQETAPKIEATGQIQVATLVKPTIQAPYSMNLYLGLQRALSSSWMLESAFVGNRGVKLTMIRTYNTVDRVTGLRPNPNLGSGDYVDDSQNSVYYSWQTSVRKRYSNHLTADIHYTWSKGLSYTGGDLGAVATGDSVNTVQNFFNWRAERGPSAGDITHSFAASAVYELPHFSSLNALTRSVIGGWQVSSVFTAATGQALLLSQNSAISPSRPDYIGGNAVLGNYADTLQYLAPTAFARVPITSVTGGTIRPGNVGNGAIRGPGRWNDDLSLGKNFHLFKERLVFQFRADAFNVFNHTNFTTVDTEITRNTFGRLLATAGARVIQLNARLSW
jgi:TonB dependent receptor